MVGAVGSAGAGAAGRLGGSVTAREPSASEGSATEPAGGLVRVWLDARGRRTWSVSVRVGETYADLETAKNIALAVAEELATELNQAGVVPAGEGD